ncbi:hypothetical protein Hanom_Chr04g00322101 [Helianthus anomalus]
MIIGELNEQCQKPAGTVHSATYEGIDGSLVAFVVHATLLFTHRSLLPLISNLLIVEINH